MAQDWLLGGAWSKEGEFADALAKGTTHAQLLERYRAALRQIADSGDGSNARLAAQALEDGHE